MNAQYTVPPSRVIVCFTRFTHSDLLFADMLSCTYRQKLLREVYAHAVLDVQPHIVRYYSAWEEDDHMLIQNEFCDGSFPSVTLLYTPG